MKIRKVQKVLVVIVAAIVMLGCGAGAPAAQAPTADINATAQAAIAATTAAQTNIQATVDAAVQQTAAAASTVAAPSSPAVTATPAIQVNYYELSEEELAALVDQSVNEAMAASQAAYTTTSESTSDGSVSEAEAQEIVVSAANADELIAETEALINAYADIYGELAEESLALMTELEQELESISSDLSTITEIAVQGAEQASAAIDKLNEAAQQGKDQAAQAQEQIKNISTTVKAEMDKREQEIGDIKPDKIPNNPLEALNSTFDFVKEFKSAFGDKKLSKDEMLKIGQLGANASAGLKQHGGAKLSGFSGGIDGLTKQMARGQLPQARKDVDKFSGSLPKRP